MDGWMDLRNSKFVSALPQNIYDNGSGCGRKYGTVSSEKPTVGLNYSEIIFTQRQPKHRYIRQGNLSLP